MDVWVIPSIWLIKTHLPLSNIQRLNFPFVLVLRFVARNTFLENSLHVFESYIWFPWTFILILPSIDSVWLGCLVNLFSAFLYWCMCMHYFEDIIPKTGYIFITWYTSLAPKKEYGLLGAGCNLYFLHQTLLCSFQILADRRAASGNTSSVPARVQSRNGTPYLLPFTSLQQWNWVLPLICSSFLFLFSRFSGGASAAEQ